MSLYKLTDQVVMLLWVWLGVRRWWLIVAFFAAAMIDSRWSVGTAINGLTMGFVTINAYLRERLDSERLVNTQTLVLRETFLAKMIVPVQTVIVMVAAIEVMLGEPMIKELVSKVGALLWVLAYLSLVPTAPRNHWFTFGRAVEA